MTNDWSIDGRENEGEELDTEAIMGMLKSRTFPDRAAVRSFLAGIMHVSDETDDRAESSMGSLTLRTEDGLYCNVSFLGGHSGNFCMIGRTDITEMMRFVDVYPDPRVRNTVMRMTDAVEKDLLDALAKRKK